MLLHCSSINDRFCKPALSISEIEQISKSISKWTWYKRHIIKGHKEKNKGAAGLDPIPDSMTGIERKEEKKRRQKIGAKYTHSLRRQRTEKAIIQAINLLQIENKRVSKAAVARKIGISRETISRGYSHLF